MPGTRRTSHTPARIDTTIHTLDKPFCYDPKCTCRENKEARERVQQWVDDGLMTEFEASEYISGRTL
jgi:acetyl-CoA carboxylase carboxyltransferase component